MVQMTHFMSGLQAGCKDATIVTWRLWRGKLVLILHSSASHRLKVASVPLWSQRAWSQYFFLLSPFCNDLHYPFTTSPVCTTHSAQRLQFRHVSRFLIKYRWYYSLRRKSTRRFVITEKAFSWLKAPTNAFTFKTLLRHHAKQTLTPR